MAVDHELTFCSQAAGWINEILSARPELPFGQVKIEQSVRGSRTRRDLTIYDRSGGVAITGEVKLPYKPDGLSPFNESVVDNAIKKALKVGARFFLTWNVNRIVLWETDQPGKRLEERSIYDQTLTRVRDVEDLTALTFQDDIRKGLVQFLERAAAAFRGDSPLGRRPLDTFFISVLEAGLERPILTVQHAIEQKYARRDGFKVKLDRWMRDTQGWHLSDDELIQRDNLERAAKFSCYVLVNKIVFYLAMRRRWKLKRLRVAPSVSNAKTLHAALKLAFADAMRVSRDYQTIFDGDFGDELPFASDDAVPAWRELLDSIERFDFTALNYDVIGPIFERLISPEERHRYGQHYTKPEVVDLINAFCIRDASVSVMDPACGGGTFLVRAYARKKHLATKAGAVLSHTDALNQLFGTDISAYATHLTTMNLATRDLIDDQNYPLVAQKDFFDVEPGRVVLTVPMGSGGAGGQMHQVIIPKLDAVVGNPPYVRQEEISIPPTAEFKGRVKITAKGLDKIKKEQRAYKKHLVELAAAFAPDINFSGRSDLHVYFWPHIAKFLKCDAHFGFLTSSGWLDVEYGFRLQEFVLCNFAILAIFESQLEPWFTGARVTTCATILRREKDETKRRDQLVKFVQIRSLMADVFPPDQSEEERQVAAEVLRTRIEGLTADTTDPHWRVRVIKQGDLWDAGVAAGEMAVGPGSDGEESSEFDEHATPDIGSAGRYFGTKWGAFLRAPDFFFEIRRRLGHRLVPLAMLAEVKFGLKTGADKFFFVEDVTEEHLERYKTRGAFKAKYGIHPFQTDRVRVVLAGDGSDHLIEAEYLEPEVHSLMDITRPRIDALATPKRVFLCGAPASKLRKSHAARYIAWGEREGIHQLTSVRGRAQSRDWYDITDCVRPSIILPKIQQYRHVAALNPERRTCNSSLLSLIATVDDTALAAVLNSTWVGFWKWFYGRHLGNEANLQLDVYSAKSLPVPELRGIDEIMIARLGSAFLALSDWSLRDLDDDLDSPGRRALDDLVLEAAGVTDAAERATLCSRLYTEVWHLHRSMKTKEQHAMVNRATTARRGSPSVEAIAAEVWDSLDPSLLRRFPEDFYGAEIKDAETIELLDGKAKVIASPLMGKAELHMNGHTVEFGDESRADLAFAAHEAGRRGPIPVPHDPAACAEALSRYREYSEEMHTEFAQGAAEKTANERLAARVSALLAQRLGRFGNAVP